MNNLKRVWFVFFAIAGLFFLTTDYVFAFTFRSGNNVMINEQDVIQGSLFVAGQNLKIQSDVNGDVYCAGQSIEITGKVSGDILCAGQTVRINNETQGNTRATGQVIDINGAVGKNITVLGQQIVNNATVGGEAVAAGQQITMAGTIGMSLLAAGDTVNISGRINQGATLYGNKNNLESNASIGGNVDYYSNNQIQQAAGVTVGGQVYQHQPPVSQSQVAEKKAGAALFGAWLTTTIISIIGSLLAGSLLIMFFWQPVVRVTGIMLNKPGACIGWGILWLFVTPIIAFILMITFVGLLSGGILLLFYILAILIARIMVAVAVGRMVLRLKISESKLSYYWATATGVAISWLIFSIPDIGGIASLLAIFWGLGGIWKALKQPLALQGTND